MKKRIYRKVRVNSVDVERLLEGLAGRVIFAIDIAKIDMVAAISTSEGEVLTTVGWKNPVANGEVLRLLGKLREAGLVVEVVMEPSGTYGDVLRSQLQHAGFAVFRVTGKRTYDAKEVLDGVPSLHDAKSAAVLALLHRNGLSSPWAPEDEGRRRLKAALSSMDLYRAQSLRLQGKMEGMLARYWPELCAVCDITTPTVLELLASVGGAADVAAHATQSRELMSRVSRGKMSDARIDAVIHSAHTTVGVLPLAAKRPSRRSCRTRSAR
jgi:transposase